MSSITLSEIVSGGLRERMEIAANAIAAEWAAVARVRLRSTTKAYLKSLGVVEVTNSRAVVALGQGDDRSNQLAAMVEFGMGPGGIGTQGSYDVRKFLLRASTRNVRMGKSGLYVNVPFPMRGAKSEVPGPVEIERLGGRRALLAARRLSGSKQGQPGGTLGAGWARRLKQHHVSDALQGVRRNVGMTSTGKERTTGFVKFRRASWANRDPRAWRSKGVRAHHLSRVAYRRVGKILSEVF